MHRVGQRYAEKGSEGPALLCDAVPTELHQVTPFLIDVHALCVALKRKYANGCGGKQYRQIAEGEEKSKVQLSTQVGFSMRADAFQMSESVMCCKDDCRRTSRS
jgi:hypothetical protein